MAQGSERKAGITRFQLIFVPALNPRFDAALRQMPFVVFFAISTWVFGAQSAQVAASGFFWAGLAVGLIASITSFFGTGLVNEEDSWITIVPILDFVALALVCSADPEVYLTPMVLLSIVPALWLGSIEKSYGFIISVVMSFFMMLPPLIYHDIKHKHLDLWEILIMLLIPTAISVASGTIHSMTLRASIKNRALLYQERRLEKTVAQEKEANHLLESILHTVGQGLLVLDADGKESLINRQMQLHPLLSVHNMTPTQLEKNGWFFEADKHTPIDPSQGPAARSVRGESFTEVLYWVGAPEELERFALSISSRPLRDEEGVYRGSVLAIQDVTTFMDALESKDVFISTVSHELRTPLTSLMGYLEMAVDESANLPPEVVKYLEISERNAQRLLTLVTDLLTVARSQRGEMTLEKKDVDLVPLVKEAVDAFSEAAREKNISLTCHAERDELIAHVDGGRISQVCENLISNAVKYTPDSGEVTVTLRQPPGGQGVEISVKDTGIGVPQAEQAQLFNKFYRALAVRNGAIPGVGLGLSICKSIVESHGGRLTLESQQGQGTTVTAFLPLSS